DPATGAVAQEDQDALLGLGTGQAVEGAGLADLTTADRRIVAPGGAGLLEAAHRGELVGADGDAGLLLVDLAEEGQGVGVAALALVHVGAALGDAVADLGGVQGADLGLELLAGLGGLALGLGGGGAAVAD